MFQTNTKQCRDAKNGEQSLGGSRGTHRGNHNGDCRSSPFANSSLLEKLTNNHISYLTIAKSGARSTQLNKLLEAITAICQDKDYDHISDILSSNTEPTQKYFLSDHWIKRWQTLEHYVEKGIVDPFIGLDLPSGNGPIDPEMVENTPIFNSNPQDQQCFNYNHELIVEFQEWEEYIANKNAMMKIILDLCNKETKTEIAINLAYEESMKTGDLIKFLVQMRKICNDAKDKNTFFDEL